MYYATIKLIETNTQKHTMNLGDEKTGLAPNLPNTGDRFFMYTNDGARYFTTSEVTSVKPHSEGHLFITENSVYLIKNIERAIP